MTGAALVTDVGVGTLAACSELRQLTLSWWAAGTSSVRRVWRCVCSALNKRARIMPATYSEQQMPSTMQDGTIQLCLYGLLVQQRSACLQVRAHWRRSCGGGGSRMQEAGSAQPARPAYADRQVGRRLWLEVQKYRCPDDEMSSAYSARLMGFICQTHSTDV